MSSTVSNLCDCANRPGGCFANLRRLHLAAKSSTKGTPQLLFPGLSLPSLPSNSAQLLSLKGSRGLPARERRHRRLVPHVSCLELPLLPFSLNEVLVPTQSKTLHLYEARYLALLEESLLRKKRLFVHFVLEPIDMPGSSDGLSFAAKYGCLVVIDSVERLEVGALVSIRGICRVRIANFVQAEPFLTGVVVPVKDDVPESTKEISSRTIDLKMSLYNLITLELKLKAPKDALLQTSTASSLKWAEKEPPLECDEAFVISLDERISFAAYQTVTGASESEMLKLIELKLRAMEVKETFQRLNDSLKLVKENISIVAAKLAIQSLEI